MNRARRILIVRLSSIGDVIHTLPLLAALREIAPEVDVRWLVQEAIAPLLEPAVPTIRFDRSRPWRRLPALRRSLRSFAPDLTIDLQGNSKSGLIARLSGAPVRLGLHVDEVREWPNARLSTHRFPRLEVPHAVERTLAAARHLGASGAASFDLTWTAAEDAAARADLADLGLDETRPVVCLNAGRTTDVRSWPLASQMSLAESLSDRGLQVLVQGGPAEAVDAAAWTAQLGERLDIRLAFGRWGLRALGAIYRALAGRPHLVIGSDSGPLHLAAATGARTLGLYGPQDPARTGPFGPRSQVLRADVALPCRPCLRRRCHHERPLACMKEITVASVAERVLARIGGD